MFISFEFVLTLKVLKIDENKRDEIRLDLTLEMLDANPITTRILNLSNCQLRNISLLEDFKLVEVGWKYFMNPFSFHN